MDTFASPLPKRFLGMVSDWPELPIGQVSLIPLPPPGGLAHPGTNHRDHRDHSTFGPRPDFFGVERPTGQAVGREITAITGITALFETGLQFWGGQGPEGWGGRKSHRPGQFQPVGVLASESSSWLLPNREGTSLPCRYVLSHPTYSLNCCYPRMKTVSEEMDQKYSSEKIPSHYLITPTKVPLEYFSTEYWIYLKDGYLPGWRNHPVG